MLSANNPEPAVGQKLEEVIAEGKVRNRRDLGLTWSLFTTQTETLLTGWLPLCTGFF